MRTTLHRKDTHSNIGLISWCHSECHFEYFEYLSFVFEKNMFPSQFTKWFHKLTRYRLHQCTVNIAYNRIPAIQSFNIRTTEFLRFTDPQHFHDHIVHSNDSIHKQQKHIMSDGIAYCTCDLQSIIMRHGLMSLIWLFANVSLTELMPCVCM